MSRIETDSIGAIEVPDDAYWGAQTQRSLINFAIGEQRMPLAVVHALALIKKAAARVNSRIGELPPDVARLIEQAADEVLAGKHDAQFPLVVWQTGSGTQSNMNVNEVIAGRANELAGQGRGGKSPVHPNDHVNRAQSSNDSFPTAMHIAAVQAVQHQLLPAIAELSRRPGRTGGAAHGPGQDRAHAPDGRHPGDLRPGAVGLRRPARLCRAGHPHQPAGGLRAGPGRYGGRYRAERAQGLRRSHGRRTGRVGGTALRLGTEQVRRPRRSRAADGSLRRTEDPGRWP